jgi:proline dehydrogenase
MVVATTNARPVEKMITGTRPGKALAHRFVAGDTLDEAIPVAKRINADGMKVSLDLLGEEVHDAESAMKATAEYLECIDRIEADGVDSNISIKLTQLGLSIDESLAMESIGRLAERARQAGTTVTIDMEDSRYTEATVRAYAKSQAEHGNLGMAIQACMRRTASDLDEIMDLGGHIRLCKGAYVEPPEVAFQSGSEVDDAYKAALRKLMGNETVKPAVATHDQELIDLALALAPRRDGYFEFQMLYGVRTTLQKELVAAGHPLRVYLPFGSQWYPYLTRRLAERPSNAWFFVRAAFGS